MAPGGDEDSEEVNPMDALYKKVYEANRAKEKQLKDQAALQHQQQQQALQQQQQQQQTLQIHQQQGLLQQQHLAPQQVYQQQFRSFQHNLQGNTGAPPLQQPQILATPGGQAPPSKRQRLSGGLFPNLSVPSGFGSVGVDLSQPGTNANMPQATGMVSPATNCPGTGPADPRFPQKVFEFLMASGMEEGAAMMAAVNISSGQNPQLQQPLQPSPSPMEAWIKKFMETQGAINKSIATGLTGQQGGRDQELGDPAELDMYKFKEPSMSRPENGLSGSYEIQDNSTDSFAWDVRMALKAPNAMPASYWKSIPGNGAQLTTPRRATSLVLTHLAGSAQINPR